MRAQELLDVVADFFVESAGEVAAAACGEELHEFEGTWDGGLSRIIWIGCGGGDEEEKDEDNLDNHHPLLL